MAAVKELLRAEADGTLSFGDFTLGSKTKKDNFEFEGDIYKVKTFSEITKLEKNGMFVYESVPGSSVEEFRETADEVSLQFPHRRMCSSRWSWSRKANMKCLSTARQPGR